MTIKDLYLVMSDIDEIDIFTTEENMYNGKVELIPENVLDMQIKKIEVNKRYGYLEVEVW